MLKKYDGQRGGYDFRHAKCVGCYNLYKNGKFIKQVDVEKFVNLKKDSWYNKINVLPLYSK